MAGIDGGCPFHTTEAQAELSKEFDAFTFMAEPHDLLARARRDAPVFYDETTDYWVVTSYESVKSMLGQPAIFSSSIALDPMCPLDPEVPSILKEGKFGARPFILNIDGEEHSEHKRIMSKVLHPRAVADREGRIREIAIDLIDSFPTDRDFDFVDRFSLEFPALVIFDFLGLPQDSFERSKRGPMRGWSCSSANFLPTATQRKPAAWSSSGSSSRTISTPRSSIRATTSWATSFVC